MGRRGHRSEDEAMASDPEDESSRDKSRRKKSKKSKKSHKKSSRRSRRSRTRSRSPLSGDDQDGPRGAKQHLEDREFYDNDTDREGRT